MHPTLIHVLAPLALLLPGDRGPAQGDSTAPTPVATVDAHEEPVLAPLADADLEPWRLRLVDLAYGAATAMPLEPHVKNRSRAQERVVATCLELELLARAERFVDGIANWRRGAGYADLAAACLDADQLDQVPRLLEQASDLWREMSTDEAQGWRRDRVGTKIARTLVTLGDIETARVLSADVDESEIGRVHAELATQLDREGLEAFFEESPGIVKAQVFDMLISHLRIAAALHRQFFEDAEQRARLEGLVSDSWDSIPVQLRLELMQELCGNALDHGDGEEAGRLLAETLELFDSFHWRFARHELPNLGTMARLYVRAGDFRQAEVLVQRGLERFDGEEQEIVNIWRAETLRPLAEVVFLMGQTERALALYARVLDLGQVNPNSRPRADDLVDTLSSMAALGVEPTPELWERITAVHAGLGAPW